MLSAIRMRSGISFQILVPVTRKVRPPSVSLLYLGHSTFATGKFIDAVAGFPGSAHDARVLRNSNIDQEAEQGNILQA